MENKMPTERAKKAVKKTAPKKVEFVVMIRKSDGLKANVHLNNVEKFKDAGYK
jgi:hypothetical protein